MNKWIRIAAGIGAVALIIILFWITIAFTGNPVSRILAVRSADEYIKEKYPDLEVEREDSYYEFKSGSYNVKYFKRKSKDIHFQIEMDYLARLKYDGYKEDVESKWNTRQRLDEEFSNYVENIIRENLNYDFNMVVPSTFSDEEEDLSWLEIDMVFDLHDIPLEQDLALYIYEEDRSWERLAQVMLEVDGLMEENKIDIVKYTINLEEEWDKKSNERDTLGVYDFPKEDIDSKELAKILEEFFYKYNNE